jgi:hypothetical protein
VTLFDDHPRSDLDNAFHAESTFAYLDRSARPEMIALRELWEGWFSRYPHDPERNTADGARLRNALRSRFRSHRERQQREAFWELYLHESFVRAGCVVTVRVDTPDFDVSFGSAFFYVEATVRGDSEAEVAADNRLAVLRDGLDRTDAGPWFLDVSATIESIQPPPVAVLRRQIETWLHGLDVDAARIDCKAHQAEAFDRLPTQTFERNGYQLEVRAIPKEAGVVREGRRCAVGSWGNAEMVHVRNAERLVDSLNAKACAVRALSAPVIVAVLLDREFGNDDHVESALFGTETTELTFDPNRLAISTMRGSRADDGVWTRGNNRGRQIDAVLSGIKLDPFSVSRATPTLWTNPWHRRAPLQIPEALPWKQRWVDEERRMQHSDGPPPSVFFGLSATWPE